MILARNDSTGRYPGGPPEEPVWQTQWVSSLLELIAKERREHCSQ
jgi:hypothetical protein